MDLQRFVDDLHEHRDSLADQIAFLEAGNQIHVLGEEPEVSTANFLASLRKHMADLDHLIPECEAMRIGPVP
jgi:hypothetical protein